MSLTRTHIAFLGIISIFTGIIGPGTHAGSELLSYLMTDIRWISYVLLIALILSFSFAALRQWTLYRVSIIGIIIGVFSLGIFTLMGDVSSIRTGNIASGLSWGWIFLVIGGVLLILSFKKEYQDEEERSFSETIDTIIGMAGGFALACIAGILILSSLSFWNEGQKHDILERMYGTGEIRSFSGGIQSIESTSKMPYIIFRRGEDLLLTTRETSSGIVYNLLKDGEIYQGYIKEGHTPLLQGGNVYSIDASGYAYSGGKLLLGSRLSQGEKAIIYKNDGRINIIHKSGDYNIAYTGILSNPVVLSENKSTLVWTLISEGQQKIIKNGLPLGEFYEKIIKIDISPTGQNIMSLVSTGGKNIIVKNELPLAILPQDYLSGSYKSNGSHFLYITEKGGVRKVIHDMKVVSRDLEEVRETFLEKDGGSYAYFGRPIGETRYCLFTRYKGNLCDLEGYMNPTLGADGGSILFAGKKNGIWSIYRNGDALIKNTSYNASNIQYDYVFFDTTNPRTYLFIEKNPDTGLYSYRKKGKVLPGNWQDVSTEVIFGYDDHIITSARDDSGWKIIEL